MLDLKKFKNLVKILYYRRAQHKKWGGIMVRNKITTCIECGNLRDICYCFCPYCGESYNDCKCIDKELTFEETKISLNSSNQILVSLKSPIDKQNFVNNSRDDFTRLEKWRIGRANFP